VLLSGGPGCGKTTLAKILVNLLEVDPFDFMEINASRENGIDTIRDKITNFVQTMPFGDFKVVLLDEFDFCTPNAQASMRHMMEAYHQTARFILTCNYPHKIIPAIHSRCQGFHIDKLDATEFTARVATVLVEEGVDFDLDTLDNYVRSTYPDLRKCLNNLQMNSTGGKLISPRENDRSSSDWKLSAVELFKSGKPTEARKLICSSARQDEMEEIFRWCYDNLDLWTTDVYKQDEAIIIIRNGLVNVPFISDQEINLSATLVELAQLTRS
jgi:replication factor C small subunit